MTIGGPIEHEPRWYVQRCILLLDKEGLERFVPLSYFEGPMEGFYKRKILNNEK